MCACSIVMLFLFCMFDPTFTFFFLPFQLCALVWTLVSQRALVFFVWGASCSRGGRASCRESTTKKSKKYTRGWVSQEVRSNICLQYTSARWVSMNQAILSASDDDDDDDKEEEGIAAAAAAAAAWVSFTSLVVVVVVVERGGGAKHVPS